MRPGQLPIDEQLGCFRAALRQNPTVINVLARAAAMTPPDWYLVAGCLYQTVWNVVTGQPAEASILDYDLAYFDDSDLSWEAEDAVIRAGNTVFAGLPAPVQIRNQARVHLWYEQKFGTPCPPCTSAEAAIDTYETTTACLGIRPEPGGRWRIYAPHGPGRRVQPRRPAQPAARTPARLPGQDRPVEAAMAAADHPALARPARNHDHTTALRAGDQPIRPDPEAMPAHWRQPLTVSPHRRPQRQRYASRASR